MIKDKRAQGNLLVIVGGIVAILILVGFGLFFLQTFKQASVDCSTLIPNGIYNVSLDACTNGSDAGSTLAGVAINNNVWTAVNTLSTNTLGTGASGFSTIFPLVVLAILIGIALSYVFNIIPRGKG